MSPGQKAKDEVSDADVNPLLDGDDAVFGVTGDAERFRDVFGAALGRNVALTDVGYCGFQGFGGIIVDSGGLVQSPVESVQVTSSVLCHFADAIVGPPDAVQGEQVGVPAVSGHRRPAYRRVAASGNPDRRIRFLLGLAGGASRRRS